MEFPMSTEHEKNEENKSAGRQAVKKEFDIEKMLGSINEGQQSLRGEVGGIGANLGVMTQSIKGISEEQTKQGLSLSQQGSSINQLQQVLAEAASEAAAFRNILGEKPLETVKSMVATGHHLNGDHVAARKLLGQKEPEGYFNKTSQMAKDALNSPATGMDTLVGGVVSTIALDTALTVAKNFVNDAIPSFGIVQGLYNLVWGGESPSTGRKR